jgi:hypothetical protein
MMRSGTERSMLAAIGEQGEDVAARDLILDPGTRSYRG